MLGTPRCEDRSLAKNIALYLAGLLATASALPGCFESSVTSNHRGTVQATTFELPKSTSTMWTTSGERPQSKPTTAEVIQKVDELMAAPPTRSSNAATSDQVAADSTYLRRISLILRGSIPDGAEARAFVTDPTPNKDAIKVDEMLGSAEFADYFSRRLTEVLLGMEDAPLVRRSALKLWIEESIKSNQPWNQIVRELVNARHPRSWYGPTNFLLRWSSSPGLMASASSRIFLGIQVDCAECHDDPSSQWTQDDFRSFSAYFAGTTRQKFRLKRMGVFDNDGLGFGLRDDPNLALAFDSRSNQTAVVNRAATRTEPWQPIQPRFLFSGPAPAPKPLAPFPSSSLRETLLEKLLSVGDDQMARAFVNRLFEMVFGKGLVDPVDAFSPENPPSHPELLNRLAEDFLHSGFDYRRTLRILANSRAARSSTLFTKWTDTESNSSRQLDVHQLYQSILQATQTLHCPDDSHLPPEGRQAYDRLRTVMSVWNIHGIDETSRPRAVLEVLPPEMVKKIEAEGYDLPVGLTDPARLDPREIDRLDFQGKIRRTGPSRQARDRTQSHLQQLLFVMNGRFLNQRIQAATLENSIPSGARPKNSTCDHPPRTIDAVLKKGSTPDRVEALFFATLSRPPSKTEMKIASRRIHSGKDPRSAMEDLFWSLLNSQEFLFVH